MRNLRLAGIAVILVAGMAATAQTVAIQLDGNSFKVAGWNPPRTEPAQGWASVFAVYAGTGDVPPLAGTYAVEGGVLVFHPMFPFAPGVHYRAVFLPPGGTVPLEKLFAGLRRDATPLSRVESVYPSSDVLPGNQLRLYIQFSGPMSRGEAGERIHVLDEHGGTLDGLFLPGQELWDPENRRLTMTFDPGRIKRGLTLNESLGPPIAEGRRYTLAIDRDWRDARGAPLVDGFRKSFRGGPADRRPPDPNEWRVTAPGAGTADPLVVDFPEPMNHALLQRMLQVSSARRAVSGTVNIARQEIQWRFTPSELWTAGEYQLIVDTAIEDLAGNHIGQPFDVDVFGRISDQSPPETISLPFVIDRPVSPPK